MSLVHSMMPVLNFSHKLSMVERGAASIRFYAGEAVAKECDIIADLVPKIKKLSEERNALAHGEIIQTIVLDEHGAEPHVQLFGKRKGGKKKEFHGALMFDSKFWSEKLQRLNDVVAELDEAVGTVASHIEQLSPEARAHLLTYHDGDKSIDEFALVLSVSSKTNSD